MKTVSYCKVGQNRGALRIWLEGQKLSRAGIDPGRTYKVERESRVIRLVFTPGGDRWVSRKQRNGRETPVIDICSQQLNAMFKADDRVRVVVSEGRIEITLHHLQRAEAERECRVRSRVESGQPVTIGTLAHGGGILDLAVHQGLKAAGINPALAFANEIEPAYLDASLRNNPVWGAGSIAIQGPMEDIEWQHLPKVDVLLAGLPCTGASLSGRSKNKLKAAEEHDTAGALFTAFLQAITILKPSVVVLENVPPYQNTVSMTVIRAVLGQLGYDVQETILSGADFGALEHRQRLCMVASSKGLEFPDIAGLTPAVPMTAPACLGAVLEDIAEDDERWRTYSYLADKEARDIAAGKGFKRQLVGPEATSVGTVGRGYGKARSTEPFVVHPSNPDLSRLMTVAEHAAVKTIPAFLVDGETVTTAHEILGQSIIYKAFEAVGQWIGRGLQANACQLAIAA